jgi:hypothetical protein
MWPAFRQCNTTQLVPRVCTIMAVGCEASSPNRKWLYIASVHYNVMDKVQCTCTCSIGTWFSLSNCWYSSVNGSSSVSFLYVGQLLWAFNSCGKCIILYIFPYQWYYRLVILLHYITPIVITWIVSMHVYQLTTFWKECPPPPQRAPDQKVYFGHYQQYYSFLILKFYPVSTSL